MKKTLVNFLVVLGIIIIIVNGYYLFKGLTQPTKKLISTEGFVCRIIWRPIYNSSLTANSEEDAKNILIELFQERNISYNPENITVSTVYKKSFWIFNIVDYYNVEYHICGTNDDISKLCVDIRQSGQITIHPHPVPRSFERVSDQLYCSDIPFKIKNNQIIGFFGELC